MRARPDVVVIGTRLPENFDAEFKARIADPVGYQPDDTEDDRAIREQMVAFKRAAAKLIAEGLTPTEIVLKERADMRHMAMVRNNYIAEIGKMKMEGASEEDINLTIEAANKLLERDGGVPIKFNEPPKRKD